jgi:hypothetical protein
VLSPGKGSAPFRFPSLITGFFPSSSPPIKTGNCIPTGANVNAKDTLWLTPLHRAAASRNEVGTSHHLLPLKKG